MRDVAIGYLHRPHVGHNFMQSLLAGMVYDSQNNNRWGSWLALGAPSTGPEDGRNTVVRDFLATDHQWLMWLDDDMGFAPNAVDMLLEVADPVERPIVGGLCFAQKELAPDGLGGFLTEPRPTIYHYTQAEGDEAPTFRGVTDYERDALVRVVGTGSAMLLVHRTVFERISAAVVEQGHPPDSWYERIRGSDGKKLGEDVSFCVRALALDIPIWVHTGVHTNHLKNVWVSEVNHLQRVALDQIGAPQAPDAAAVQVEESLPAGNRQERRSRKKRRS